MAAATIFSTSAKLDIIKKIWRVPISHLAAALLGRDALVKELGKIHIPWGFLQYLQMGRRWGGHM